MTSDIRDDLGTVGFTIVWDAALTDDPGLDLDISGFALNGRQTVVSDEHFVFFNNDSSPDGAVRYSATDSVSTPSEHLTVNTDALGPEVEEVAFAVTVYDEVAPFRRFRDARIIVDDSRRGKLAEYDLSVGMPDAKAVVYGKLVKDDRFWRFCATGDEYGSLMAVASDLGVNIGG